MSTLLKIAAFGFSLLSPLMAARFGKAVGFVWFHLLRIRRKTVLSNLEKALPHRRDDHLRIAAAAYRHFGIFAVEFLRMSRMSKDEILKMVEIAGMEHFASARSENKGVIVVTAHLGNFDLLAASQAAAGIPLAVVSRQLHQGGANRFWMESRKRVGVEIFEDKGAAKQILRSLKANKVVALTVDQRTRAEKGGVLLPFMGNPALTTTAPALLAAVSGAPIVPVHIHRGSDGLHLAVISPKIPAPQGRDTASIMQITKNINVIVEKWVSQHPEQYMWLHRRFVTKNDDSVLSPRQSRARLQR